MRTLPRERLSTAFSSRLLAWLCVGVTLLTVWAGASADIPRHSIHFGLRGGGHVVFDDFRLRAPNDGQTLNSGGLVGLTFGGFPIHWFGLEATADLLVSDSTRGGQNLTMMLGGDVIVPFSKASFAPHFAAGGGVYLNVDGDLGSEMSVFGRWGLGLRGSLTDWLILRVDARHVITRGFTEEAHNLTITAGFDFLVLTDKPPDTDGDGVADTFDACPNRRGAEMLSGCPDTDGDGVPDHRDQCTQRRGPEHHAQCVFGRSATLTDVRTRCAAIRYLGCPDSDGDDVSDKEDRCPLERGPHWLAGCPDADGDAVADVDDQCRLRAGPKDRAGCPDTDNDTVIDDIDHCPRQAGPVDRKGCPVGVTIPDSVPGRTDPQRAPVETACSRKLPGDGTCPPVVRRRTGPTTVKRRVLDPRIPPLPPGPPSDVFDEPGGWEDVMGPRIPWNNKD